jgi:cytochrome c oxidase subunit II
MTDDLHLILPTIDQNRINKKLRRFALPMTILAGMLLSSCSSAGQPSALNPKGPAANQVANLSWLMFGIAAIVLVVVTFLLLIVIFRRKSADLRPQITQTGDRRALTLVVIGGAVIPAIVLMILMGLSISIENVSAADNNAAQQAIEVIGHQWWWEVRYPAQGFDTANEIHIPVGRPVTLKITSADVIHSFWVPQLHPKLDMIPGQTNTLTLQADTVGSYLGECAEYCGEQHAHMQFVVIVQPQAEYDQWLAKQQKPAPEPKAGTTEKEGQQVFLGSSCVYCHTIQGTNASGRLGPDLTHLGSRVTIGAGARPNSRANLAGWIMNAQAIKPGSLMPPMDLAPDQLEAILAYLQTLK